jgi:hypothetical protein
MLHAQQRAEHVGVQGRSIALGRLRRYGARFAFSTGSIDGHIQATKPCDRLVYQAAHLALVAYIGAQKLGFGSQLAEFSN